MQRTYANSATTSNADELFDKLYKVWIKEHHKKDTVSGRFLGLLSLHANVFELGQEAIKGGNSHRVYTVFQCLGNAFLFLESLPLQGLINLIKAQYEIESRDQVVAVFYSKFGDYLSSRLPEARQLYAFVNENL